MRTLFFQRILVSLLAFAVLGLVPIAFGSPAEAARAKRDVSATAKDVGRKIQIKGAVTPGKFSRIFIQKRRKGTSKWRLASKMRTNKQSRYAYTAPLGTPGTTTCYRIVVPGNKNYSRAFLSKFTYGNGKGAQMCIITRRT